MLLFKKCCCCIGLQTGTVSVGWIGLLFSVPCVFVPITLLSIRGDTTFSSFNLTSHETKNKIYLILWITFESINILVNAILIWGAYKKTKLMLIPWLTTFGLKIFILILSTPIGMAYIFSTVGFNVVDFLFSSIFLIILGTMLYFWMCILSYYQKLVIEERLYKINQRNAMLRVEANAPSENLVKPLVYDDSPPAYDTVVNL